ncbi:MAG: hypothetical protein TECD_01173 [Hyphomicrobiaceae bacterium hypho_1]
MQNIVELVVPYWQEIMKKASWSTFSVVFSTIITVQISNTTVLSRDRLTTSEKLPQFASLKSNPTNLRTGPGRQYSKKWVFKRSGLPVEIVQTHETWRRIRASDGTSGWISQSFLSRRRTAIVLPWDSKKSEKKTVYVNLRSTKKTKSNIIAHLQAGSLVNVKQCNGVWCFVTILNFSGYISQKALWGVYLSEKIS